MDKSSFAIGSLLARVVTGVPPASALRPVTFWCFADRQYSNEGHTECNNVDNLFTLSSFDLHLRVAGPLFWSRFCPWTLGLKLAGDWEKHSMVACIAASFQNSRAAVV